MELWAVLKHRRQRVARERQRVLADDVLRHVLEGLLDSRAALLLAVKNLRRRANDRDGAGRSNCAGCIGRADHSALIDAEEGVGDREAARVWLAAVHVEVADKQTPFLSRRHVVHLEVDLDIHVHCWYVASAAVHGVETGGHSREEGATLDKSACGSAPRVHTLHRPPVLRYTRRQRGRRGRKPAALS